MKLSNYVQLYAEPINLRSGNDFSSEKDIVPFSLPGSGGTVESVQLPIPVNSFLVNNAVAETDQPGITLFRAFKNEMAICESPLIRIKGHQSATVPNFGTYLKEIDRKSVV